MRRYSSLGPPDEGELLERLRRQIRRTRVSSSDFVVMIMSVAGAAR